MAATARPDRGADAAAPPHARIAIEPARSTMAASRSALLALILRDLVVLRKNNRRVRRSARSCSRSCWCSSSFTSSRRSVRASAGGGGKVAESAFATVLVPGVVGITIMFQGIQAVAMVMAQEFGYTREIEDRVQAPCPIWLVAVAKVLSGATQGLIAALIVFPIASVVHAGGVEAHLSVSWPIVITLIPLACVTMTSLGLLAGDRVRGAQPRADVRVRRAAA